MKPNQAGKLSRTWGKFEVDYNLEDSWLMALNQLYVLDLRNICEGHLAKVDPDSRRANITVVVYEAYQELFLRHWNEIQEPVIAALQSCFNTENYYLRYIAERQLFLTPGKKLHIDRFTSLFIQADKRHARKKAEFDQETRQWFESSVDAFQRFDYMMLGFYDLMGGEIKAKRRRRI